MTVTARSAFCDDGCAVKCGLGGEGDGRGGAAAELALEAEAAAVAVDDVFDDGEAKARAAHFAGAAFIHAVETLGQAGDVLACDAVALVGDLNDDPVAVCGRAGALMAEADGDGALRWGVAERVLDEVAEGLK